MTVFVVDDGSAVHRLCEMKAQLAEEHLFRVLETERELLGSSLSVAHWL
jgi:hypothetical protein